MPKSKTVTKRQRAVKAKGKEPYAPAEARKTPESKMKSVGKKRSANFSWFLKVYKGLDDWHIPIFRATRDHVKARHVLYPGCDKHVTVSLFFPSVVYVDCNKKMEGVFKDELVLNWVNENKTYPEEAKIKFLCKNFETTFEKLASFDLLISACAGIVSEQCVKYLKPGGFFLVSDAHFDARSTFLRPDFKLVGAFDQNTGKLLTKESDLAGHFHTVKNGPITRSQVEESMEKPKNRRSFSLQKEANFYLFKKSE